MTVETGAYIVIFVLFAFIAYWWLIRRNTPDLPPLIIETDDPLMIEAFEKAKSSIPQFKKLLSEEHQEAQIKVPFTTSSGETEHLWAEVLEHDNELLSVRYYTPPVTHDGELARLHEHNVSELEDWVVFLPNGDMHGGFTQRVMFKRGREQWGELPPELEEQESKYVA